MAWHYLKPDRRKRMADFAKIVRATDGTQVLFYKDNGDDGKPVLKQITDMDGITGAMNLSFSDDDEGYDRRDAAFDRADVTQADALRHLFAQALEKQG
jgi:hypothetical protein